MQRSFKFSKGVELINGGITVTQRKTASTVTFLTVKTTRKVNYDKDYVEFVVEEQENGFPMIGITTLQDTNSYSVIGYHTKRKDAGVGLHAYKFLYTGGEKISSGWDENAIGKGDHVSICVKNGSVSFYNNGTTLS